MFLVQHSLLFFKKKCHFYYYFFSLCLCLIFALARASVRARASRPTSHRWRALVLQVKKKKVAWDGAWLLSHCGAKRVQRHWQLWKPHWRPSTPELWAESQLHQHTGRLKTALRLTSGVKTHTYAHTDGHAASTFDTNLESVQRGRRQSSRSTELMDVDSGRDRRAMAAGNVRCSIKVRRTRFIWTHCCPDAGGHGCPQVTLMQL